ncbi:hypothetical protein [Frigidibacter sp. ROC022]|uniref:hypothetical protein n=1 Tax=Frigidibacter sp. ROC022 TaxID=2971796 RepID=UPI0030835E79
MVITPADFVEALVADGPVRGQWNEVRKAARAAFEVWTAPRQGPGPIQMFEIMGWLDANLPVHQRCRQFLRLTAPLPPLQAVRNPGRAGLRVDGVWYSGIAGGEIRTARVDGDLCRWRR